MMVDSFIVFCSWGIHAFSYNANSIFSDGGAYKGLAANAEELELIAFRNALDYAEHARFAN